MDSTMKVKIKEQVQAQVSKIMPKIEKYVTESLGAEVLVRSTNQPQTSYAVAASLSEFKLKKNLIDKIETNKSIDKSDTHKNHYNALVKSYNTDKDIITSDGSKKRRSGKEAESSKEPKNKESKSTSSSKSASKSQPKSLGKSAHAKEHDQKAANLEDQPYQEFNIGNEDVSPVREALNEDVWHRNLSRPPTPDREWHKTKTESITKTKATDYGQVKWIEDKGPKRHKFYGYASNMETSKDVYSRHRIIAVTSLKIMKWFGYSHLEEIIVRRQDDQLYKFREGNFKRLRRQYNEDMLLLLVQDKLTNLNLEECVEDLQLGVESYQKKINLKNPDTYCSNLRRMTPYTAYPDIQGIIYEDEINRNCLMRTDELHKFSDGTLNHVHYALNDIALGIEMEYLPKRKWSKQDRQRARVMINAIDKKLKDRRLMRSLEKFVGGRPYGGDLRLLERTI
ncbi:hypothetical protein Tco_0464409 [Tanacetum coccineum]